MVRLASIYCTTCRDSTISVLLAIRIYSESKCIRQLHLATKDDTSYLQDNSNI